MNRRTFRRGNAATTPLAQAIALSGGMPMFDASLVELDGVSGKVRRFYDRNDPTHYLEQTNTALQVAAPAAHADFGGALCVSFTGTEYYDSNRAGSYWQSWSDGSGRAAFWAATLTDMTATRYMFGANASNPRWSIIWATTTLGAAIADAGGTTIVTALQSMAVNTPHQGSFRYREGAGSPEYRAKLTGVAATTGDSTGAPSATSPGTFRLGMRANGTLPGMFRLRCLYFAPNLTDSGMTAMATAIQRMTGIAP